MRVVVLCTSVLCASCQVEQLFPVRVGDGAARLTVGNVANLLSIINNDTRCGFESPDVKDAYVAEGELGSVGRLTWTVEECTIDFGWEEPVAVSTDCNGKETRARGKLVISATRTVEGILTGNPETPVIPVSPDAVHIDLKAVALGYEIQMGDSDKSLLMKQALIEMAASVHLAQSASLGVCAISTSDVTIDFIKVTDAVYEINAGDGHRFDVVVPSADIEAQVGRYGDRENWINGKIQVWDTPVDLSHDETLDPDYDRAKFESGFSCTADLKLPLEYACLPIRPRLAEGAAKLTIATAGNFVSAFSKDTTCGFQSEAVRASPEIQGEVGRDGGSVVYRVAGCTLDFGDGTRGRPSCDGSAPLLSGRGRFSGSLTIRGRLTGDPAEPIIPTSRDAVEIAFKIELDHAKVQGPSPETMEVLNGTVTGKMRPRMAIDTSTGACAIDTPVVTFGDVSWSSDTRVLIRAQGNALSVNINGGALDAQNGNKDGLENYLAGSIVVDGEEFRIPLTGAPTLDPSYDRARFMESFACIENLRIPQSDAECSMHQIIGDGVARLVIQTVGTVAGAVNADANCGYSNKMDVLRYPSQVVGNPGQMGSLSWRINNCALGPGPQETVYATDCTGGKTFWQGRATVDSARTVRGLRTTVDVFLIGTVAQSVKPQSPQSVDLWLYNVRLQEFSTYALAPGQTEPLGVLVIHEGTLEAFVQPTTAYDAQQGYVIATPIARISGVHLRNARATLYAQNKTFELEIADTELNAVNGRVDAQENEISGTVTIDGDVVTIGGALNPNYNAAEMAASYACNRAPDMGVCSQLGKTGSSLFALLAVCLRRAARRRIGS